MKPEEEVKDLFSFLDRPFDGRVFKAIRKPSKEARKDSASYR